MEDIILTEENLIDAIKNLRDKCIKDGLVHTYYDINNGLCSRFAKDIIKLFVGENDQLYTVENGNFMIGKTGDEEGNEIWDRVLLENFWNIYPTYGLTWDELNKIDFGFHVWIVYNNKFYDAECPKGATNFFKLPIFANYIKMAVES